MNEKRIFMSPPDMSEIEKQSLIKAFDSNWIAPMGPCLDDFEQKMSEYLGGVSTCSLSSGTAALHLALRILGIKEGDKVLCPSLTFAATANVILYEKAIPVFLDVDINYWISDINLIEEAIKRYKPRAFITVDIYGQSYNYDQIIDLCQKHNIFLIEDSAEALGSEYNNKKLGSFGDIGILSFNGNKMMTTGGGGMLVSENKDFVRKAKFLSTQARELELHYEHKELGFNYRLSNLLAAIGIGQLRRLEDFIRKRRRIFKKYYESLSQIEGFDFMSETSFSKCNRWLTTLTIDEFKTGFNKNKVIELLDKENIESRPVWKPMHLQPLHTSSDYIKKGHEDVSKKLFERGICLPSGSNLLDKEQDLIIDIIKSLVR